MYFIYRNFSIAGWVAAGLFFLVLLVHGIRRAAAQKRAAQRGFEVGDRKGPDSPGV